MFNANKKNIYINRTITNRKGVLIGINIDNGVFTFTDGKYLLEIKGLRKIINTIKSIKGIL